MRDNMKGNLLIHGDNLEAMRYLLEERGMAGKVDLVYIDPPFATGLDFTIADDRVATISAARGGEVAYSDRVKGKDFVEQIRQRCQLVRQLLSDRGSVYLHTDYKIGHYIKVMMDEVFGEISYMARAAAGVCRIRCGTPLSQDRCQR